jgi:hypothetical protein
MQSGDTTEPIRFASGKWYVFKLEDKRLQTENLTLESPGVRPQITQALTKQRKDILNAALLEVAMNESKIVNNMAGTMLSNPGNLGLRPASPGNEASPAAKPAASVVTPQSTSSPTSSLPSRASSPAASPKASASPKR